MATDDQTAEETPTPPPTDSERPSPPESDTMDTTPDQTDDASGPDDATQPLATDDSAPDPTTRSDEAADTTASHRDAEPDTAASNGDAAAWPETTPSPRRSDSTPGGPTPDELVAGTWDENTDGGAQRADVGSGDGRSAAPPPPPPPPTSASWPTQAQQPGRPTAEARNWAMGAHLSAFVGAWVALAFLGPLVVWLVKRDDDRFVEHHAKEALNFNLTMFGLGVLGFLLVVLTLGLGIVVVAPLALVFFVAWVVFPIIAAVRASNGEGYRYPLSLRLVK